MYKTTLVLSFIFYAAPIHSLFKYSGNIHEEKGTGEIRLYGDIHYYGDAAIKEKEEAQVDAICTSFQKYKGARPLHIFIEVGEYNHLFFRYFYSNKFMILKNNLQQLAQRKTHIVEDFDIRKLTRLLMHELYYIPTSSLKTSSSSSFDNCYTPLARDVTFQDVFLEIERYTQAITHACKTYLELKWTGSAAEKCLQQTQALYSDLRDCCSRYYILPNDKIVIKAQEIKAEQLFYSQEKTLQEYLFDTLLDIAGNLCDVALFLKVLQAHEQGKHIIVYGGNGHIKQLKELLLNYGFCGHLSYDGFIRPESLRFAFSGDGMIGCPLSSGNREGNKCPFTREFPELPPCRFPEKEPTQCVLF